MTTANPAKGPYHYHNFMSLLHKIPMLPPILNPDGTFRQTRAVLEKSIKNCQNVTLFLMDKCLIILCWVALLEIGENGNDQSRGIVPDNIETLLSVDTKVFLGFRNNWVKKITTRFDKKARGNFNSTHFPIFFFISMTGVPSKISNPDTSIKFFLTASTLSSERAMGFGLIGLRVVKTPRCFLDVSPLG